MKLKEQFNVYFGRISGTLTNLTEKEKLDRVELDVKCLQLLRGLIHNEIVKLPDEWEAEASKHRK